MLNTVVSVSGLITKSQTTRYSSRALHQRREQGGEKTSTIMRGLINCSLMINHCNWWKVKFHLPITKTDFLLVAGFDGKNELAEIAFKTTLTTTKTVSNFFLSISEIKSTIRDSQTKNNRWMQLKIRFCVAMWNFQHFFHALLLVIMVAFYVFTHALCARNIMQPHCAAHFRPEFNYRRVYTRKSRPKGSRNCVTGWTSERRRKAGNFPFIASRVGQEGQEAAREGETWRKKKFLNIPEVGDVDK
jgi:hypothetical protein